MLSKKSESSNTKAICLKPSKTIQYYRFALLGFAGMCLWHIFDLYSLLFIPCLLLVLAPTRSRVSVLYLSEPDWSLYLDKGEYHRFKIVGAWFASWCIILTIQSNTFKKSRLLIFSDQLSSILFKYLIFQIKKSLFRQI
jgi:hypothetical protein